MSGFVDLHSHVLYGLDDGAKTRDESLAMLRLAHASGTTDIVATPHANSRFAFTPSFISERIADLAPETPITIHRGCDFHLHLSNIQDALAHPQKYTIDGGPYLLVELSEAAVFSGTERILSTLIEAGMVPVITHPERHRQLQSQPEMLAPWIELGCFVQVTAASLTGLFGKSAARCAHWLVESGVAHFVSSDAHDSEARTPDLREAYGELLERWDEERIRPLFVDNPRTVIEGGKLEAEAPPPVIRKRKWYQFW
jgi:protein-tyrosine phosphatase